jgi:hypothetical protein
MNDQREQKLNQKEKEKENQNHITSRKGSEMLLRDGVVS